jgi:hypothetical protein
MFTRTSHGEHSYEQRKTKLFCVVLKIHEKSMNYSNSVSIYLPHMSVKLYTLIEFVRFFYCPITSQKKVNNSKESAAGFASSHNFFLEDFTERKMQTDAVIPSNWGFSQAW